MKVGYTRALATEQNVDSQLDILKAQGCERIYKETITGSKTHKPDFTVLDILREGDTLVVDSFSRLARSTKELVEVVDHLNKMKVDLISLKEQLDTTTATGKLMLTMLSALSQFERDIIAERTRNGLKAARVRGRKGGRPHVGSEETKAAALALYDANAMTNKEIANNAGVSIATLNRWIAARKRGA